MLYFCVENDKLISILQYAPAVPSTVSVISVDDEQRKKLEAKTHYFDPQARVIREYTAEEQAQIKENESVPQDSVRGS